MKVYPSNFPGAVTIDCATGGHGRCLSSACECWCHNEKPVEGLREEFDRRLAPTWNLSQGSVMTDAAMIVLAFAAVAACFVGGLERTILGWIIG